LQGPPETEGAMPVFHHPVWPKLRRRRVFFAM
jgi:hypothetical protein